MATAAPLNEHEFARRLRNCLERQLPGYKVVVGEPLLYKLIVDGRGKVKPSDINHPVRGQLAFETDVLIKNESVPLVVAETKLGRFTTHDVLTYSAKARSHKNVYPYLRYGLVVGAKEKIDTRFFTHNRDFDFAVAISDADAAEGELKEIITKQLRIAEGLISVLDGAEVRRFESTIDFR